MAIFYCILDWGKLLANFFQYHPGNLYWHCISKYSIDVKDHFDLRKDLDLLTCSWAGQPTDEQWKTDLHRSVSILDSLLFLWPPKVTEVRLNARLVTSEEASCLLKTRRNGLHILTLLTWQLSSALISSSSALVNFYFSDATPFYSRGMKFIFSFFNLIFPPSVVFSRLW